MRRRSEEGCLRSNLKRVKMKGAIFCKITIGRLIDPRFMAIHAVQDNRTTSGRVQRPHVFVTNHQTQSVLCNQNVGLLQIKSSLVPHEGLTSHFA